MLQQCRGELLWLGCEIDCRAAMVVGLFSSWGGAIFAAAICVKPFVGPYQSYTLQILAHIV